MTLSPTLPLTLTLIFSSKLMAVVLRLRIGSDGLSIFLSVAPNLNSAEPCVLMRTPPGPKIFSAGPKSKCISEKSNFSLPFVTKTSVFLERKKLFRFTFSVHFRYSGMDIMTGAASHVLPIFEPIMYELRVSLYSAFCSTFSGASRSAVPLLKSS